MRADYKQLHALLPGDTAMASCVERVEDAIKAHQEKIKVSAEGIYQ
jgi:hypothetical protein